jgi:hypothetical protein
MFFSKLLRCIFAAYLYVAILQLQFIDLSYIIVNLVYYSYVFQWFNKLHPGRVLTVRDLISWVAFFDITEESLGPEHALLHGAFLVLLDGLSLGMFSL